MDTHDKKIFIALIVSFTVMVNGCSIEANKFAQGQVTTWRCEKEKNTKDSYVYVPYEYIIQAPGDVLAISSLNNYEKSIILYTTDSDQNLPVSWIVGNGYSFKSTDDKGFSINGSLEGYDGKATNQVLILNGKTGKLYVKDGQTTSNLKCTQIGDWKEKLKTVKYGPGLGYLEERLSVLSPLRKKVGDPIFSSQLAKEKSTKNDYSSVYGLLSPLKSSTLSRQEIDLTETAKNKLIEEDSDSYDVWVWNNSWHYQGRSWELSDDEKAYNCSKMSGSRNPNGYQIISSTPQDRIGYKGLVCHGTLNLLRKEGSLNAEIPSRLFPDN